eukprot:scaffold290802_cov48-Attheya_sp.AAC.1
MQVVQLLLPTSVWDQNWIRKFLYLPRIGDTQRKEARLGVEYSRFYVIRGGCLGANKYVENRETSEPFYRQPQLFLGHNQGAEPRSLDIAFTAVHGAKKYENANINDNNNKSYLASSSYHRVLIETLRVSAGAGDVSGTRDTQRERLRLSKPHGAQYTALDKKK